MKKSTISSTLVLAMTILSFGCYVYLHQVAFEVTGHCPSASTSISSEEKEAESTKILLPDIALVKHILGLSKYLLNAN